MRTVKFCQGAIDGIEAFVYTIIEYQQNPDKFLEAILPQSIDGEILNETSRLLIAVFKECGMKGALLIIPLMEMAYMAWNSPEILSYSEDKEKTAYQFGYIIGSMLLTIMITLVVKNVADILSDKQLMRNLVENAKLQFRGLLTQRDSIALAVGSRGGITIQIGMVYTTEAVGVIEGSITTAAEQGIILKAGKILAAGYPAGKIEAETAKKICKKVEDGETDAEEIAEDIEEEADKWGESGGVREKRLALGVWEYLDDFANEMDAHTWKDFPDRNNWKQGVLDAIQNPEMEIFFNLDGIDDPWAAITRASKGAARATEWELLQIKLNPEAWGRVTWYKNGIIVPNPFE